tara:strand:+ start:769 stop:951 length:183 start_codon:yes stop_codon:yes gene_type:complete
MIRMDNYLSKETKRTTKDTVYGKDTIRMVSYGTKGYTRMVKEKVYRKNTITMVRYENLLQ